MEGARPTELMGEGYSTINRGGEGEKARKLQKRAGLTND